LNNNCKRLISALLFAAALVLPCSANGAYRLLELDGHPVKWGKAQLGTGAVITYNLAGRSSRGGMINCRAITPLTLLLRRSRLTGDSFERALNSALHAWEAVANVRFVRVANNAAANLTIGAEQAPDGTAYTDVTPVSSATNSVTTPARAVICLNPVLQWTVTKRTGARVLGYVLEHEIGHTLGLDHPSPSGELMSFEYSDVVQTLQPGDVAGITFLYGPAVHAGTVALSLSAQR